MEPSTLSFSVQPRKERRGERRRVGFSIKREISLGVLMQILIFLISGVYFVAGVEGRMEHLIESQARVEESVQEVRVRLDRIEKYLSSKDLKYWQAVKSLEEETRK